MQRKSKNLVIFLIPMVIACSVTIGFGGMITSTVNPIIPEILTEEVMPEAPVVETVVAEPEIIEIAAPDPVVVEEVAVEEPEVVIEEPVVRATSIMPIADATPAGWNVMLIEASGVYEYTIDLEFQAADNSYVAVPRLPDWAHPGPRLPRTVFSPGIDVPIVTPTAAPKINEDGTIWYRLTVWAKNGGEQTIVVNNAIDLDWIYSPPVMQVMEISSPFDLDRPTYRVTNLGEQPLIIIDVQVDSHTDSTDIEVLSGELVDIPDSYFLPIHLTTEVDHYITIFSNAGQYGPEKYVIKEQFLVTAADMNVGIGSERFGLTLRHVTKSVEMTVTACIKDSEGNLASPEETFVIDSNAHTTTDIVLKTLFVDAGADYQYVVTIDDVWTSTIVGVSLNHWADFTSLKNAGSDWEAIVNWDPVTADVITDVTGELSVFVALRKWDGDKLWDVEDSEGNEVVISEDLADGQGAELADGAATLLLAKPDSKNLGTEVVGGETWMTGYGAGYYFFTYMAPTSATNPWAERIGCPPEGL